MRKLAIALGLIVFTWKPAHAVRAIMEGIQATNNAIYVGTTSPSGYVVVGGSLTVSGAGVFAASSVTASSFFGDGAHLSNVVATTATNNVLKSGDTMTGQLTTTSTITVQGSAFSVGVSTFVVAGGQVGVGVAPAATFALDISAPAAIQRITSSVGTNPVYSQWANLNGTSGGVGNGYIGLESSAGGAIMTGTSNYAFVIESPFKRYLQLGNGTVGVRMTFDNSNNVGIGTASPATLLDINGQTTLRSALLVDFGSSGSPQFAFKQNGTNRGFLTYWNTTSTLNLQRSGSAEANGLSIDASDRVGIGTTSPQATLDVVGTASGAGVGINVMTTAQIQASTPLRVGVLVFNSTKGAVCVSTGTTVQAYEVVGNTLLTTCQ